MKKQIPNIAFAVALAILGFIFLVISLSAITFLLGGSVSKWLLVLSILGSGAGLYYILYRKGIVKPWLWVGGFLLILATSVWFGSVTIDSTYDGNSYHKTAIGALKNGWNPVHQNINEFNSNENTHKLIDHFGADRVNDAPWVNSYPKATWIFAANIYKLTGNIESGKAINLLAIITVFLLAFSYLYGRLGRAKSILVGALLTFNPIAVAQIFGYFNDGMMGNFLVALLVLLTILIDKKSKGLDKGPLLYAAIFITLVTIINIKFTGLAYAGITVLCYWLYLAIRRDWKTIIKLSVIGAVALLFGLLVVGASSYVKNTFVYGNPLYPLAGNNSIDIMTHNQPASYADKSGLHKFIEANLSPTSNVLYANSLETGDTQPKIPFTISVDELKVLGSDPDLRQAGYGVWFGGILIVSFIVGVYLLIRYGKRYKNVLPLFILPLVSVAVVAIAFDNSWWGRYLPQLYVFPMVVLVSLLLVRSKALSKLLIFLLLFNVILTGSLQLSSQSKFVESISKHLDIHLRCDAGQTPRVFLKGYLSGAMYNLWDRCETATPITQDEFNTVDKQNTQRLITDIYLIKAQ